MLPLPSLHRRRRTGAVILTAALLAGGLAAVGAPAASAADTGYFVDCDASTPGDGTAQSPWDSLSAITAPAGGFRPGDALSLRAGTVCTGSFELSAPDSLAAASSQVMACAGKCSPTDPDRGFTDG